MCYADAILLPSSTSELAAGIQGVVAAAAAAAAPGAKPISIRATSSVFHSTTPFPCPEAYGGGLGSPLPANYGPLPPPPTTSSAAPATAAVLLDSLRGVSTPLAGDPGGDPLLLTVLAGSRLWQVWHWAAERGLSPPRGVPTVWSGEKERERMFFFSFFLSKEKGGKTFSPFSPSSPPPPLSSSSPLSQQQQKKQTSLSEASSPPPRTGLEASGSPAPSTTSSSSTSGST